MVEFEVGDVVHFTQVDMFEYDSEEIFEIQMDHDYIIVDLFDDLMVFTDSEVEFVLSIMCCQFIKKIRDTRFTIGDDITFETTGATEIDLHTNIKIGEVYRILDLTVDESLPIVNDGKKEVVLYLDELLFAKRVIPEQKPTTKRKATPRKKPVKKDYKYVPVSKEMEQLQKDVFAFGVTTLIDNALDSRDFDELLKIILDPNITLNNEGGY